MAGKVKYIPTADGGIIKNVPKNLIPDNAWTDGMNVRFGVGYLEKVEGWTPFNDVNVGGRVMWIDNFFKTDSFASLMVHTHNKVFQYNDVPKTVTDITREPFTLDSNGMWNVDIIENRYLMTNLNDNIYFWDGIQPKVEKMPGLWDPPEWSTNHTYEEGDYVKPLAAQANGFIYRCNVIDPDLRTGASGGVQPVWPTTVDSGVNDNEIRWELAGTLGVEGGNGTIAAYDVRAKCILNYNNFCILGHTVEDGVNYPQRIRWSQWGNSTRWKNNEDGSGQAGYADLSEGVDWIQAIKPLGPHIVVYKERSIQVLSYVGGDLIFEKRPAIIGTGLLAPHALIDLGNEHIFIGPDNIYSFDLVEPKIAGDDIWKDFIRLLYPAKTSSIGCCYNEDVPEVIFPFYSINNPLALDQTMDEMDAQPDMAIVYNTDTKKWSIREMPITAYGFYNLQSDQRIDDISVPIEEMDWQIDTSKKMSNAPINIAGDKDGNLLWLSGQNRLGDGYEAWAISKIHDMENPTILKRLMRVQILTSKEGSYNLSIWVGTTSNADEEPTWNGPYYMNMSHQYPPWIDVDLTARFFCLKLGTYEKEQPFRITGYILTYEERGDL